MILISKGMLHGVAALVSFDVMQNANKFRRAFFVPLAYACKDKRYRSAVKLYVDNKTEICYFSMPFRVPEKPLAIQTNPDDDVFYGQSFSRMLKKSDDGYCRLFPIFCHVFSALIAMF